MLAEAFAFKRWGDERTLAAMAAMDQASQAQQLSFAQQQLNHIVIVEELFRARLSGEPDPHSATNTPELPGLESLRDRLSVSNDWFAQYVQNLPDSARNQTLSFRFADGKSGTLSRLEILFHIINHASYHRGAIGHALDLAEANRPADTYPLFIHAREPERRAR